MRIARIVYAKKKVSMIFGDEEALVAVIRRAELRASE
jgi:hypothetical protein